MRIANGKFDRSSETGRGRRAESKNLNGPDYFWSGGTTVQSGHENRRKCDVLPAVMFNEAFLRPSPFPTKYCGIEKLNSFRSSSELQGLEAETYPT